MKIEEGKYYKTRDGRKVGPMERAMPYRNYDFCGHDGVMDRIFQKGGEHGSSYIKSDRDLDLIAEWTDGPVRTETGTKRRIVPGVYGPVRVEVQTSSEFPVMLAFVGKLTGNDIKGRGLTATELDELADTARQLAEALRDDLDRP